MIALACRLTDDELRQGLERSRSSGREWPPSLPQFEAWCRERPAPAHRQFEMLALPEPEEVRKDRYARHRAHVHAALVSLGRRPAGTSPPEGGGQ